MVGPSEASEGELKRGTFVKEYAWETSRPDLRSISQEIQTLDHTIAFLESPPRVMEFSSG
jgi:hypothetical protein